MTSSSSGPVRERLASRLPGWYRENSEALASLLAAAAPGVAALEHALDATEAAGASRARAALEAQVPCVPGAAASEREQARPMGRRDVTHAELRDWLAAATGVVPVLWPGVDVEQVGGELRARLHESGAPALTVVWPRVAGEDESVLRAAARNVPETFRPVGLKLRFAELDSPQARPRVDGALLEGELLEAWL